MDKFLKENWFVLVIAIVFAGFAVYFGIDKAKDILPSKTVGGKDVVASVNGEYIFADDIYDEMYDTYGENELRLLFQQAVVDSQVEMTEAISSEISGTVQQTIAYYETYYGYGEDYLNYLAKYHYGYPNFQKYVEASIKAEHLLKDYISEHQEEFITKEFLDETKPRIVRYCLIKMDNPENPTTEELTKLQTAQAIWSSMSADQFEQFATGYSDDKSTSDNGGLYGYIDVNTGGIDEAFKNAALELSDGQVSDWVYSEQFGYFLLKCNTTKYEDLKEESGLMSSIIAANESMAEKVIWEKAQEAGVTFANEEIEKSIKEYLNID